MLTEYSGAKYTDFVRAEDEALGESKGMIKTIISFFKDVHISEKDAAKRANMSLEDFNKSEALYCN